MLGEVDDTDATAAPVRDVEMFTIAADDDRVRVLADRDGFLEQEGVGSEFPEFMAAFIADIDGARLGCTAMPARKTARPSGLGFTSRAWVALPSL